MNAVLQVSLVSELQVGNFDLQDQIARLEDEIDNLSGVIEYMLFHRYVKNVAEGLELAREFLRFVSLHFVNMKKMTPPPSIENFWHSFILHTKLYREFCERNLGRPLDHDPQDHWWGHGDLRPVTMTKIDPKDYNNTLEAVGSMYSDYPREIWRSKED